MVLKLMFGEIDLCLLEMEIELPQFRLIICLLLSRVFSGSPSLAFSPVLISRSAFSGGAVIDYRFNLALTYPEAVTAFLLYCLTGPSVLMSRPVMTRTSRIYLSVRCLVNESKRLR